MSIYYRKESYREQLFRKNIHLQTFIKSTVALLPVNFSNAEFVTMFKQCYTCTWNEIVQYCADRKRDYERRKSKGLRTVKWYTPHDYLMKYAYANLKNIRSAHQKGQILNEEERSMRIRDLTSKSAKKVANRSRALQEKLIWTQEVCPSYVKKLIYAYFSLRKKTTLDVNARYLILLEASQFKCSETIDFLHKVSACDKNYDLQLMAFYSLQRMGEHPWLARKRKGKKSLSQLKVIDIQKNPTALLDLIYSHQELLYQRYDVFLSHSSLDVKELLYIKSVLNSQGLVVYIDWINDRVMLNRDNQDENTWAALGLRMRQSAAMLFILTDHSVLSDSTKKEVMYFEGLGKRIFFYRHAPHTGLIPEYLQKYEEISLDTMVTICKNTEN